MTTLEGASKYLNNLLLARGLLQNGKPIDFAYPAHGSDSTDATMAKIINLVHDLVLRRDRDSEQHEALAAAMRNLRSMDSQRVLDLQHAQDETQKLRKDLIAAQTQDRSFRSNVKRLETQIKELKEQNLKMKSMLDQVRAKCTSDVKKRDTEIEKLKGHLIGMQRGKKEAGGMKINTLNLQAVSAGKECQRQDVNSADWGLEKETNDFLAAIVNETSTENVSLRQIVADTLSILSEMTGVEADDDTEEVDGIGIPGQYRKSRQNKEELVPVEELAGQMDTILQHCQTILKDPSFVPIEEVQVRDEEIAKLKIGWEKMADRWREAVTMMSQWKQRMALEGKSVDADEMSDLSFGRSIATRPDGQPVLSQQNELSSIFEESKIDALSAMPASHNSSEPESDLELEKPAPKRIVSSPARRGIKLPRPPRPLGETDGNIATQIDSGVSFGLDSDTENHLTSSSCRQISTKMTVPQKLAAIQAEAAEMEESRKRVSRKRKSLSGTKNRRSNTRRTTLSRQELAEMINLK